MKLFNSVIKVLGFHDEKDEALRDLRCPQGRSQGGPGVHVNPSPFVSLFASKQSTIFR